MDHRDNQQPSPESQDLRTCRKCGDTKPLDEFAKVYCQTSRGRQYKSHTCLICSRKHSAQKERVRRAAKPEAYAAVRKRWYGNPENKAKAKQQKKRYHQTLKDEVFEAYGGYRCSCCGETTPCMLAIDHVDNDGAEHRKKLGLAKGWAKSSAPGLNGATMYHWLKNQGFPSGFQVLCYNCNISKHRNKGVCAHKLSVEGSTTIP